MGRKRQRKKDAARARDGVNLDPLNPAASGRSASGLGVIVDVVRGVGQETQGTYFCRPRDLTDGECTALYTQGLTKRMIDLLPAETLAGGFVIDPGEVTGAMEIAARKAGFDDFAAAVEAEAAMARRLDVTGVLRRTWQMARVYGDAIAVVGYPEDAESRDAFAGPAPYGRPINWMRVWDRRDFRPRDYERSPSSPRYGEPQRFDVFTTRPRSVRDEHLPGLGLVHASRCLRLQTDDGRSFFQRVVNSLAALMAGSTSGTNMIGKAGGLSLGVENWEHAIEADEATSRKVIYENLRAWNAGNPMVWPKGMVEIDSPQSGSLSGIADALYTYAWLVCADAGIPMSKLFLLMPGGFSTDESSRINWELTVETARDFIAPSILVLRRHTWAATLGAPAYPADLEVQWKPIRAPTTAERAEALKVFAEALQVVGRVTGAPPAALAEALARIPEADGLDLELPEADPVETDAAEEPPTPPPGTWRTAAEIAEAAGTRPNRIEAMARERTDEGAPLVHRRKEGSRWVYHQEEAFAALAAAIADERSDAEKEEIRREFRELVNMSPSEIEAVVESECGGAGDNNGRVAANRVIRLLEKPQGEWTSEDYSAAVKVTSYIKRASKIRGGEPVSEACEGTTNEYSLKRWGHDPNR